MRASGLLAGFGYAMTLTLVMIAAWDLDSFIAECLEKGAPQALKSTGMVEDPRACYEESLGRAIRSAHLAMLTTAYLANHTPRQAAACGISLPPMEVMAR